MTHLPRKYLLMAGLAAALWICSGSIGMQPHDGLVATATAPHRPLAQQAITRLLERLARNSSELAGLSAALAETS